MKLNNYFSLKDKIILILCIVVFPIFWFSIPSKLFNTPLSYLITDKNDQILGAHIATDEQYRFALTDSIPDKYIKALITFEDKRFYYHPGIDILAILRAAKLNISKRKIVSGGSTITMQVIRLAGNGKERTIFQKTIEIIKALRLELTYSKHEILNLYAANAPYGGNNVGIDAAMWRYFGTKPQNITWAQAATLAVLPNSPSLIHPGKNRTILLTKRNKLLKKLLDTKQIDITTYELAIDEPIPDKPTNFPSIASHLLSKITFKNKNGGLYKTTIDINTQRKVSEIVNKYHKILAGNGINNAAVIVIENKTGNIISYIGNTQTDNNSENVDMITAKRSTGSILKPFLYASMLNSGNILPNSLVYDIPTYIGGYSPKNYSKGYDGAVKARNALARSLNIPAVRMLKSYGLENFYEKLKNIGYTSLNNSATHYGLSLILGGSEGSLWDIAGIFSSMARTLNNYELYGNKYLPADYHQLNYNFKNIEKEEKEIWKNFENESYFDASAIWLTFNALLEVDRPGIENNWTNFSSSNKIAWKTGTSFGFKDAWAIGVTPEYTVGVWTGNADGEGRPGLIGSRASAPILFNVFKILPSSNQWFKMPIFDMIEIETCEESGFLVSQHCENIKKVWVPKNAVRFDVCPFHQTVYLNKNEEYRVNLNCEASENIIKKSWFVLPATVEKYFKLKNPKYKFLPPLRSDCSDNTREDEDFELIYPYKNTKIYIPIELDGSLGKTVFQATHRNKNIKVFWYLNNTFIAETTDKHEIELRPIKGKYTLTLIDENGKSIKTEFEILNER